MARPRMATQVEQLPDDKVRLTVDVPANEVHHAVEHAANDLAQSVRIPGFRKGKVPRPPLVQRLGQEIANGVLGLSPGERREIAYELGDGSRRNATVVLKELTERVLPPLDEDVAKATSEFDTLDELRSEIEERLKGQVADELEGL